VAGQARAEVVGREVREVAGDAVWADVQPRLSAALRGQQVPLERQRFDRQGNPVWHSGRHVPDITDDGSVVGVYTVFSNITQRALAEERFGATANRSCARPRRRPKTRAARNRIFLAR